MDLLERINSDLKQALLSGDKTKADTLKSVKNSLQYAEVSGKTRSDADEDVISSVLKKESKKRQEAAEAYARAENTDRSDQETKEKEIIDSYLPEPMGRDQVAQLVESVIVDGNIEATQKNMGLIIKSVRDKAGPTADGALIASIVKEKVSS
jgi:hypothetical protein